MPHLTLVMSKQIIIRKVTGVKTGFSNSALRTPYALIQLECGHVAGSVETVTALYRCCGCGNEMRSARQGSTVCPCGSKEGFSIIACPNPHKAEDRLTMPVACHCKECETEEAELALIPEYVAKSVHSRFREWGGGIITFYAKDGSSPTGVLALATIRATPRAEALIRKCNSSISPLSPTEGLARGTR